MDYSTWKYLNDNGYRPVEYIYKPDNFTNPNFGLGVIAYGNKYGLEMKMQASQEDIDYAMANHQLQICGYFGLTQIDNLPYSNCCTVYIRHNNGYYLGRQNNKGWYTKPDGTITNNSSASVLIKPCDTNIHIVSTYYDSESDTVKTFLDGVLKGNEESKSWENDLTAGTEYFVYGLNNSSQYTFKGRIYYIKTFDPDRRMTGYFLPCIRKSDGKVGLYDVVNDVFKVPTYDYIKAGPYTGQRLPYDYKEVEYIKNLSASGGLDTGIHIDTVEQDWEVTFKADVIGNIQQNVAGYDMADGVDKASESYVYLRINPDSFQNQTYRVNNGDLPYSSTNGLLKSIRDTEKHTARIYYRFGEDNAYHRYAYFDGVSISMPINVYSVPYTEATYYLFGTSVSTGYTGRIYSFKRYDTDGNVITNYVPCVRMSDNTPGFYDLVSNEFKTITDATTKWEAGPDIITEQIPWTTGTGNIRLMYTGVGNGTIIAESDETNLYEARSAQFTVRTTDGSNIERTITISQAAKERIDISNAVVTAANQTYSGSALTPTPTVTLNGETITSSGYDVAYSDNTNAGTATITVTGKGAYTGVTVGTFTINKATPTYTAPTAITGLTYSGSSQYLVTVGSTSHGTIQYSSNGTTWSTTIPSSTNAGSYTTYWRLVGDSNHNDVASTPLSTTIAKASRTLSFADSYVVLNTSSNVTKTATPSAGSGDGAITYSISSTTYATINSSSGKVTSKTSDGSAVVTATIAEGTNYLSASASYTLYVFATTHNYDYTGSAQNVELPAGKYKLQCWGAQGGSNAAASSYGITAKAGGKGGYSEGVLTLASKTTVRIYVGGAGSSSAGGFNGGGSTTGSASYNSSDVQGVSRMGGGGGATDIRLSDGALLSRMIVAGGGSGGAMCYNKTTTTTTIWETLATIDCSTLNHNSDGTSYQNWGVSAGGYTWLVITKESAYDGGVLENHAIPYSPDNWLGLNAGDIVKIETSSNVRQILVGNRTSATTAGNYTIANNASSCTWTVVKANDGFYVLIRTKDSWYTGTITIKKQVTTSSTTTSNDSQVGFVGGGTTGGGYSSTYQGKQNSAGGGGSFGQGANQTVTNYRYASGAGGGGWYGGGGGQYSDSSITTCRYSGGGSGFVNTAANASYRPSGYTGLQLDSGETKAGNTSFPSTSGGTETGHSGNGYARITRLS